jgi:hypothetical protein
MTDEYIGIMAIARMNSKFADWSSRNEFDICQVTEELYSIAIEINPCFAAGLGDLYELFSYPIDCIEKCYHMAIESEESSIVSINLACAYKKRGDEKSMLFVLHSCVSNYKCAYSMTLLALHYAKVRNIETCEMFYKMALKCHLTDKYFTYVDSDDEKYLEMMHFPTFVDNNEIVSMYENIHKNGWNTNNAVYRGIRDNYLNRVDIRRYCNKKRLFESLNHTVECGICYDVETNIDLLCGHCVCIKCYWHFENKACPFCRD